MSLINKFIGNPNKRQLKKIEPLVKEINSLESEFERFSNTDLKNKTRELKEKRADLDKILSQAFALVREAAKRTIGQRHFDVQLMSGIALHQGKITEMKTGEGKTLAATLPIFLNALTGKGVHVITVNDYLARRDTNWMGPIYHLLGLSCACLNHQKAYIFEPKTKPDENETTIEMENLKEVERNQAYEADIVYGTNHEFGFDYLRDNMAQSLEAMVQREPYFAILDEVDSILIDEARTPLIISMPDVESTKLYEQFSRIVPSLKQDEDYNIDEKAKTVVLTEQGIHKVEKTLGIGNIYTEGGIRYVHHLEQALRAQVLFKKDKDYVVKNNEVIIVDEFTGRLMPGRRYSEGLHQALEAKERVRVQHESRTLASITIQNYFRMYPKLAGMTGTALTSAEEFHKVYDLDVIVVPTNKPLIRKDLSDLVYKSELGKFKAIVKEVKERNKKGQPVLIGTVSIEKNELLSAFLKKEGIKHQILNAKNHEQEAQIIARAGKKGAVTVATNMAGRGVDIVLGEGVNQLGGLCVIGTERHEARRIDDQLRGRSGRQGDPGTSRFFVSLEDSLMRIFGGERLKSMMEMLKIPEDQPIENKMVTRAIASAQSRIEGYNFDIRKHVLEYDNVMNKQREVIYKKRKEILKKKNVKKDILEMIEKEAEDIDLINKSYYKKEKELGENVMRQLEKALYLRSIDMLWMEHIDNMSYLRDSVRLRAYGQKDPLVEYKNEGIRMFQNLLASVRSTVVNMILKVSVVPKEQNPPSAASGDLRRGKVGRNDPCPCGGGKKYKKCHGKT